MMNVHNTSIDLNVNMNFFGKLNHATHGKTNYFTLTNKFKNHYEEVIESNELSHQIDELEQGQRGYIFDSIKN